LLATTVRDIHRTSIIDDGVTVALEGSRERSWDDELAPLTVARIRDALLVSGAAAWAQKYRNALASEVVAAVAKVMTSEELSTVARTLFNPLGRSGIGCGDRRFDSRTFPASCHQEATEPAEQSTAAREPRGENLFEGRQVRG
jgi:ethanolamine ammonia-lyase large subunit